MNTAELEKPSDTDSKLLRVLDRMGRMIIPPPPRSPWQWAEAKRELPKGSAEPGPFDTSRAPWVRGITRAVADPKLTSVVGMMGSQMSKTDGVILNSIGWQMDDDPLPVLYIGPTQKNAESISRDRLTKMIESVPSLWNALAKGQKNKNTEKYINGVRLGIGWSGSATELASHPAAKVFIDERDRMSDIKDEGDVNTLAGERTATFDGCVITTSTPTLGAVETEELETGLEHWKPGSADEVLSSTWKLWQEGSRHEWAWPCPECREYYIPRSKLLVWPENSTMQEAFKESGMVCPHCGTISREREKGWMNQRGVFVAPHQAVLPCGDDDERAMVINVGEAEPTPVGYGDYLEPDDSDTMTFWVSGLCSVWRTFGHRARTFLRAVRSHEDGRIQAAINTGYGELYQTRVNAPDWKLVAQRREPYGFGQLPDQAQVITMGVDVQKRSLIYAIRAWGAGMESWLLDQNELVGETRLEDVWQDLADVIETKYGDDELGISKVLIDTGYNPSADFSGNIAEDDALVPANMIYEFCRTHRRVASPIKGFATQAKPLRMSTIDVSVRGRMIKNGLQLWSLDTDYFKTWVHDRLEMDQSLPGQFRISADATDDYCMQIVAEARTLNKAGKAKWVKVRRHNHYLDCEMMNVAAAHLLRLHRLTDATLHKYRSGASPQQTKKPTTQQRTGGGWLGGGGSNWINR